MNSMKQKLHGLLKNIQVAGQGIDRCEKQFS